MQPIESQHRPQLASYKTQVRPRNLENPSELRCRRLIPQWNNITPVPIQQRSCRREGALAYPTVNFFAHPDGCSPHTEELRRSSSPSAVSIASPCTAGSEHSHQPPVKRKRRSKRYWLQHSSHPKMQYKQRNYSDAQI